VSRLRVWASDAYEVPLPPGHPFPMAKYRALRELLLAEGVVDADRVARSEPAPVEWLLRAHDPAFVERALGGGLSADGVRRLGMPGSQAPGTWGWSGGWSSGWARASRTDAATRSQSSGSRCSRSRSAC